MYSKSESRPHNFESAEAKESRMCCYSAENCSRLQRILMQSLLHLLLFNGTIAALVDWPYNMLPYPPCHIYNPILRILLDNAITKLNLYPSHNLPICFHIHSPMLFLPNEILQQYYKFSEALRQVSNLYRSVYHMQKTLWQYLEI